MAWICKCKPRCQSDAHCHDPQPAFELRAECGICGKTYGEHRATDGRCLPDEETEYPLYNGKEEAR